MAAMINCPLNPNLFLQPAQRPMGLSHLLAIENHVSCVNSCPHPPLKELIFDGRIKGTTPLLLACHCGDFESVKHIVESWGIDVRDAATYYLHLLPYPLAPHAELLKIESATPLFVAAFQGHGKIVRYLLEKGANVTAKTSNEAKPEYDGLTPLDGAVFEHDHWAPPPHQPVDKQRSKRNPIVLSLLEFGADISASKKPLWTSRLCGVDTTMALINHGLDVKQRDPFSGRTLLHYWASPPHDFAEEDSLTIVKLLIEKGADIMARDNYGFTPIITAACGVGFRLQLALFGFLLERDDIDIMEKIEAMELAGAYIFSYARNAPQFPKACYYWRRATDLRQVEGFGSYQKKLAHKSVGTVEWITFDQLERIIHHPSEYKIKNQSFLVQLRILSSRSWAAVNFFLEVYLGDSELEYMAYSGKYLELLDIYWAMLETILLFQPSERGIWARTVDVFTHLIYTLSNFKDSSPTLLNVEIIKKSIHLIIAIDRFRLADRERVAYIENRYSNAMFSCLTMLLGLPEMLDDIWGSLLELFRHLGSDQLGSLLLLACKDYKNAHYSATIRLLLQLGANIDATDNDGNRPLHLVAKSESEQSEATGCILMGYGAQLYHLNNFGETAVELWIQRNQMVGDDEEDGAAESWDLPDWCRIVRKLKCLSASCIRFHDVPFKDEPEFFQDSHNFIEKH